MIFLIQKSNIQLYPGYLYPGYKNGAAVLSFFSKESSCITVAVIKNGASTASIEGVENFIERQPSAGYVDSKTAEVYEGASQKSVLRIQTTRSSDWWVILDIFAPDGKLLWSNPEKTES